MRNRKMREGWIGCKLGDLLILKNGYAFKSSKYITEGIPVIRIGDINNWIVDESKSKCIAEHTDYNGHTVEKGDILIAMSGATTGKFGVYESDRKAYQNQRVGNLKPKSDVFLNKKYIFNLLYSLKYQIEKEAYGGAQPNISASKIHELNVILPPLPEQRAIVTKIEELFSDLDKGIADLKKAQDQLKVYRQAVLKKAFEGDFEFSTVGDSFDFIGGGTPSKREKEFWNGKIPWASVKDIKGDFLNKTQDFITEKGLNNSAANLALKGEVILITRISPRKSLITNIDTAINQDLKIVKPRKDFNTRFVYFLFRSIERDCIKLSSGTTVLGINLQNLKSLEIPIVEIDKQHQIVREIETRLSVCDKVEQSITESLEKAKALRQSILKKAFEGTLLSAAEIEKCKQAKDYEPASVLLERIKGEKK